MNSNRVGEKNPRSRSEKLPVHKNAGSGGEGGGAGTLYCLVVHQDQHRAKTRKKALRNRWSQWAVPEKGAAKKISGPHKRLIKTGGKKR